MTYLAGMYVGDLFAFFRGNQDIHRHPNFRHISVTPALRQLDWTLFECVQHVTEKGKFEAQREHESYLLVRRADGNLCQEVGPYDVEDEEGKFIARPHPQSSRWGLTPVGVMQLCILLSEPFRAAEDLLMADVRPRIKAERRKPQRCRDRRRLVEALADVLLAYEASIHALEDLPTVCSRLNWSAITQVLSEHFDALASDIDATLKIYRGERSLPDGFDLDWLQGVLQVYPELKTFTSKDIRQWLARGPAVAHLLQAVPGTAYAQFPWPNPPFPGQ